MSTLTSVDEVSEVTSLDLTRNVYREPTKAFSPSQLMNFFFKAPEVEMSFFDRTCSFISQSCFFTVSSIVQCIRYAGYMHTANVVGSLLSDFPSAYKMGALRSSEAALLNERPTKQNQVIVLYLPAKDGQWKDYTALHQALEQTVGKEKVAAHFIEGWEGGGDMKEAHIDQVRKKIEYLNERCPNNPIVVVGWSHGAEILPWALVDPDTYEVDEGTIYSMPGRPLELLTRDSLGIDHLFRLCSPMTEKETAVMSRISDVPVTEVCSLNDCLLPSEPSVSAENQVWIDEGHVGVVFSATVVQLVANKVLDLHAKATTRGALHFKVA